MALAKSRKQAERRMADYRAVVRGTASRKAVRRASRRAAEASAVRQPAALRKSHAPRGAAGLTSGEAVRLAGMVKRLRSGDPWQAATASGDLIEALGPDAAARILGGQTLSPEEFTRAYLRHGRARQQAAPGQAPRIPPPSYVISADDFRRDLVTGGRERDAPGSLA